MKEGNPITLIRLLPKEKEQLLMIAEFYNCTYGGKPKIGELVRAIARGDLVVIKKNFPLPLDN